MFSLCRYVMPELAGTHDIKGGIPTNINTAYDSVKKTESEGVAEYETVPDPPPTPREGMSLSPSLSLSLSLSSLSLSLSLSPLLSFYLCVLLCSSTQCEG